MKNIKGIRVEVWDAITRKRLGCGTCVGNATVYFWTMPDGSIRSLKNAEKKPPKRMRPEGTKLIRYNKNMKIRLDNGRIVYGCQIWWKLIVR